MTEQKVPPLFTAKFTQGRRTFFFDVKKSKNEKPFLKITSSALKGEEKQRTYMTVFDNEVMEFQHALAEATSFIVNT
ncbi:MAG: PUR family DNA/RNA-binding protein [Candidatus Doudnabacteria bacterium]|nr:PUR family DNA/RNA-binding protein [Candidatus Doudnabacteria bacterium]